MRLTSRHCSRPRSSDEAVTDVVTGAFSYTGRAIAARLLADGREVRTLSRSAPGPDDPPIPVFPLRFDDATRFAVLFEALFGAERFDTVDARFVEDFAFDARVVELFFEAPGPRFAAAFAFEDFFALVVAIRGALAKSVPDDYQETSWHSWRTAEILPVKWGGIAVAASPDRPVTRTQQLGCLGVDPIPSQSDGSA